MSQPAAVPDAPPAMIRAAGLRRTVRSGDRDLTILNGLDLTVEAGELVCIRGPSGSGKSTLLGLLAGLDHPTAGRVEVAGTDLASLGEEELALFRSRHLGFVFQSFHLLANLTALENIGVPLEIAGEPGAKARAEALLDSFGLAERGHHLPSQLSGGEQQRVAIARAISNEPAVVLADEPTGNLDEETGGAIAELLLGVRERTGAALVVATHDSALAALADRRLRLRAGRLHEDDYPDEAPAAAPVPPSEVGIREPALAAG